MLAADFALGEALWTVFVIFLWITWLWLLFAVFGDLFSDPEESGWGKAGWTVLVLFLPYLGIFIYLIARGGGMAERQMAYMQQAKSDSDKYIREVAGRSPAQEIADAKALLDAGSISADDFEKIKTKALA